MAFIELNTNIFSEGDSPTLNKLTSVLWNFSTDLEDLENFSFWKRMILIWYVSEFLKVAISELFEWPQIYPQTYS